MQTRLKPWWPTYRIRHALLEFAVAVCLAFLVWLYTHSRAQHTIDRVQIPVQVELLAAQRDQFLLETSGPQHVLVSFSGPASRIREVRHKLQRGLIQAKASLTIPEDRLSEATFTETVRLDAAHVPTPPGVHAELAADQCTVALTVYRVSERTLPVKFDYTGDVRVTQLKLEPATVTVRGPKQVLDQATALQTQPQALTAPAETSDDSMVRGQVALPTELEGRSIQVTPRHVTYKCKVTPKQRIYELPRVPVRFLCPSNFPWRPRFASDKAGTVHLRLLGPTGEETPPVIAFVDLTGAQQLFRGRNLEPLRLQLPKDFTLVQSTPQVISFYLDEVDRPMVTGPED